MSRLHALYRCSAVVAAVAGLSLLAGADWLQFRGAGGNSVTRDKQPPVDWSADRNIAWKVDLPGRGPASPIVVGNRVIVTASGGANQERLHVLCFDVADGKKLWERQFWATGRTLSHPDSANAAPTPASDGKLIFAFFSSNDLVALDLEGNLQWFRGLAHDFPRAGNDVGMSSSPVVAGDVVIAQVECQGDSFATAIDKATGETRWRVEQPHDASWASPVLLPMGQGPPAVLLQSPAQLSAHDSQTGKQLWVYKVPCDAISSAAVVGGVIYVPSKGMTALQPEGAEPKQLWNAPGLQPGAASPVVADGQIYLINRGGVLTCGSTADGQVKWRVRLEGAYWGTPALVGNRLYCNSHTGAGRVVEIDEKSGKGEIVGKGELEGPIQSSPAISAGALYVRSDKYLWKIAAP